MTREDLLYFSIVIFLYCFPPALYFFIESAKDREKKRNQKTYQETDKKSIKIKNTHPSRENKLAHGRK